MEWSYGCKRNRFRIHSAEIIFIFVSYLMDTDKVTNIKWMSKVKIKYALNEYEYERDV
jgi:hypothetical protein